LRVFQGLRGTAEATPLALSLAGAGNRTECQARAIPAGRETTDLQTWSCAEI